MLLLLLNQRYRHHINQVAIVHLQLVRSTSFSHRLAVIGEPHAFGVLSLSLAERRHEFLERRRALDFEVHLGFLRFDDDVDEFNVGFRFWLAHLIWVKRNRIDILLSQIQLGTTNILVLITVMNYIYECTGFKSLNKD